MNDDLFDLPTSKDDSRRSILRRTVIRTLVSVGSALVLIFGILFVAVIMFFPANRSAGPAALRSQCLNNLRQIGIALSIYESKYGALPPAFTVDSAGNALHSWRTLILPFLDQQDLYESIDLSRPWNDPINAKANQTDLRIFECSAADLPQGLTCYQAIVGPHNGFLPDQPRPLSQITNKHSNVIIVIESEADRSVHWMSPLDTNEQRVMSLNVQSELSHPGGVNALNVDGSIEFFKVSTPEKERRALISITKDQEK